MSGVCSGGQGRKPVASARPPLLGTAPCPHVRRARAHNSLTEPRPPVTAVSRRFRVVSCAWWWPTFWLIQWAGGREEGWKGAYMTWLRAAAKRYRYLNTPSTCSFEFQAFLALYLVHRARPMALCASTQKQERKSVRACAGSPRGSASSGLQLPRQDPAGGRSVRIVVWCCVCCVC